MQPLSQLSIRMVLFGFKNGKYLVTNFIEGGMTH